MKLNILKLNVLHPLRGFGLVRTHEGAPAAAVTPEQALRRSVLSCMFWEREFYEDGVKHRRPHQAARSPGRTPLAWLRWPSRPARR